MLVSADLPAILMFLSAKCHKSARQGGNYGRAGNGVAPMFNLITDDQKSGIIILKITIIAICIYIYVRRAADKHKQKVPVWASKDLYGGPATVQLDS